MTEIFATVRHAADGPVRLRGGDQGVGWLTGSGSGMSGATGIRPDHTYVWTLTGAASATGTTQTAAEQTATKQTVNDVPGARSWSPPV